MVSRFAAESKGIGSGFLRLYTDRFGATPIPLPSGGEQNAAIDFIRKIGHVISRFIRNKRQLIELLNEQKQVIINRAVTRGINPDVRLKPSGIDWLGDVPERWRLRRLKYLVRNVSDHTASKLPDEVYIALENIESWTGRVRLPREETEFDSQVKRFQAGDILFGKLRPYLAKVTRPSCRGVCVSELLVLRLTADDVLPEFLEQKLRSVQIIDFVNSSTFGAKMPRADWSFIGNLVVALPASKDEQRQILATICEGAAGLDEAMARAQREIELIREYRTRLIADVVTGKVDVRRLAPEGVEPSAEDLEPLVEDEDVTEDELQGPQHAEPSEEMDNADE